MSSKNINSDNTSVSNNTNTTFILSNENVIQNPAQLILENPNVGIDLDGTNSNLITNTKIGNKNKKNYILDDGPQYDDDELTMRNRGGRINRKMLSNAITSSNNGIPTIDEIRQAADEAGLVGNTQTPIIQLSNPNINFLILIYPTKRDSIFNKNGLLVTGTHYYEKLKSELKNKNPYAYNIAFDDRFIVKLILKDWVDLFKNLQNIEEESGVLMIRNNFINDDYSIDYNQLIGFIDWFVSKPDYIDFSDKGVIPASTLSFYNLFPQSILTKLIPTPPAIDNNVLTVVSLDQGAFVEPPPPPPTSVADAAYQLVLNFLNSNNLLPPNISLPPTLPPIQTILQNAIASIRRFFRNPRP
jgi:hypothetical protein